MDLNSIVQAILAIGTPVAALIGVGSRRRRLRAEIRENLSIVESIEKTPVLRDHTPVSGWLQGRIALDVAKLSGQPLGTPKKPLPKGSIATASIIALIFGAWTYYIVRDGFVWYSVFPALVSVLMVISIVGMTTDRQLPPEQSGELPGGAVPVQTASASEQIVSSVAIAATGADERFATGGQIGVAFRFIEAARSGHYEEAIILADDTWLLCRIQAWLWNNRPHFGDDLTSLERLAETLHSERTGDDWLGFVDTEREHFIRAWESLDPGHLGAASSRRRIGRDFDLVVLAPVGDTGGYFVPTATALPNALTFVMHRQDGEWLLANHLGTAPPQPGVPPAWWVIGDPAIEQLAD